MATVTETYILQQDEGKTSYPSSASTRLQTAIDNGTIVSFTKTPITSSGEIVAGKTKFNVAIVWKSAADRNNFITASQADSTLQAYIISSNLTIINRVIS
jgi:hypothetical protein